MKKIKINRKVVRNIFILTPFFELLIFEQLVKINFNKRIWELVLTSYSILRILFTGYAVIKEGKKIKCSITVIGISIFVIIENFVSAINGSIYLNYCVGSLTIIGLALNCDWMICRSKKEFTDSCYYLFGVLSIFNMMSVLIWPNGFFNARIKAYAIYFLGSKNTAFFYYIVFLYFAILRDIFTYKKIQRNKVIWILLFIYTSYICDSANSLVLFIAMLFGYFIWYNFDGYLKKLKFTFVLPVVFVGACFILVEPLREFLTPFLEFFGRESTFTGRDVLWKQAFMYLKNKPLVGNGISTTFILGTGAIADHAHSHYLDILAKYGFFSLVAFLIPVIKIIKRCIRYSEKLELILNLMIISILLVHSVLDHLMIYNFVLILVSVEGLTTRFVDEKNVFLMEK